MATHDPQALVESLRDHMAAHDRALCFLLGAGASAAVKTGAREPGGREGRPLVPAITELTQMCAERVQGRCREFEAAWERLTTECEGFGLTPNIENILSRLRLKIDAVGPEETALDLQRKQLESLDEAIRQAIVAEVSPDDSSIPGEWPHRDFAMWLRNAQRTIPVEIFTTNYDTLLERALETVRLPYFDGFVGGCHPFFSPECVEDEEALSHLDWVRVWKLHGSVNWDEIQWAGSKRIVRTQGKSRGEMILPSHRKYDESRKQPYRAFLDRLGRALARPQALIVICGYSFGDEHINAVLFGALEARPGTHAVALKHGPLGPDDQLAGHGLEHSNLMVVAPNAAVLGRRYGTWRLARPLDDETAGFMDTPFDTDADPDSTGAGRTGTMRLGDFNWFCRFLGSMEMRSEGIS